MIHFQPLQRSDEGGQRRTQSAALTPNVRQPLSAQKHVHWMQTGYPIALRIGRMSAMFQPHVAMGHCAYLSVCLF
jgi:hypothetical protein